MVLLPAPTHVFAPLDQHNTKTQDTSLGSLTSPFAAVDVDSAKPAPARPLGRTRRRKYDEKCPRNDHTGWLWSPLRSVGGQGLRLFSPPFGFWRASFVCPAHKELDMWCVVGLSSLSLRRHKAGGEEAMDGGARGGVKHTRQRRKLGDLLLLPPLLFHARHTHGRNPRRVCLS